MVDVTERTDVDVPQLFRGDSAHEVAAVDETLDPVGGQSGGEGRIPDAGGAERVERCSRPEAFRQGCGRGTEAMPGEKQLAPPGRPDNSGEGVADRAQMTDEAAVHLAALPPRNRQSVQIPDEGLGIVCPAEGHEDSSRVGDDEGLRSVHIEKLLFPEPDTRQAPGRAKKSSASPGR